jgi:hypothetical protein
MFAVAAMAMIDRAAPWPPALLHDRIRQPTPLAGDGGVDREGIKRRLDDAEPPCAKRALVGVLRYERTEVELGERCDADRSLDVGPSSATGLPETVIVNCSPVSTRGGTPPTSLQLLLWNGRHASKVALLATGQGRSSGAVGGARAPADRARSQLQMIASMLSRRGRHGTMARRASLGGG